MGDYNAGEKVTGISRLKILVGGGGHDWPTYLRWEDTPPPPSHNPGHTFSYVF